MSQYGAIGGGLLETCLAVYGKLMQRNINPVRLLPR